MPKGNPSNPPAMPKDRTWILFVTVIICISIAISGVFFYPLNTQSLFVLVLYETLTIVAILGIMKLVYERGLPEEVVNSRKET